MDGGGGEGEGDDEADIRASLRAGDVTTAATKVIRAYGAELLGYLHAVAETPAEADDAFGDYCERLMRGLATFRGDSTLRTWSYRVVRNLHIDRRRAGARARARAQTPRELSQIVEEVSSATRTFLETRVRDRLARIRASLPEEDRTLLVLRIDRQLSWNEVAQIMLEHSDRTAAARLRKRFERLVARLRTQLVDSDDG